MQIGLTPTTKVYYFPKVLDDPIKRAELVAQGIDEIKRWADKYRHFEELKELREEIDRLIPPRAPRS